MGSRSVKNLFLVVALALTIIGGTLTVSATATAQTPYLKEAASSEGLVVLSEKTGNIYYCPAAFQPILPISPIGSDCHVIDAIPTTSLSGNGFVSMSFASAPLVIITGNLDLLRRSVRG